MVRTSLVENDIQEGRRLISALTESDKRFNPPHYLIKTAFWLYDPNSLDWRLIIATPLVDQRGPLSAYTDILGVLRNFAPPLSLSMQEISVVSPKDKRARIIRKIAKVPRGSTGIRVGRTHIDDTYVEDAYVYPVMSQAA